MNNVLSYLHHLCNIPTAPFYEQLVLDESEKLAKELFGKNVTITKDKYQNLILHYKKGNAPPIALVVHSDHPAFHIEPLENKKEFRAVMKGGLNPALMLNTSVQLYSKNQTTKGKIIKEETLALESTYLVEADMEGNYSFATLDLPKSSLKGKLFSAPVLDDIASIAVSYVALQQIIEKKIAANIYIVLHRAEEVGFIGAYTVAMQNILPKETIVISLETSSYVIEEEGVKRELAKVGSGAIIRTGDKTTPLYNMDAIYCLHHAAKTFTGKIQERRMYAGSCEASLYYAFGYRAAGLCLPLIAWHNNGALEGKKENVCEQVHLDDIESAILYVVHLSSSLAKDSEISKTFSLNEITPQHLKMKERVAETFKRYQKLGFI